MSRRQVCHCCVGEARDFCCQICDRGDAVAAFVKPTILKETNVGYAASSGAPVPPAGDVEVLGYVSFVGKDHVRVTLDCHAPTLNTQVVNRVYATQLEADCQALQSERDGLLGKLADTEECYRSAAQRADLYGEELKSTSDELTKARELIDRALTDVGKSMSMGIREDLEGFIAHNVDESCGQDAEAAKGALCKGCAGYGTVSTGIEECPTTICNTCDGTGQVKP